MPIDCRVESQSNMCLERDTRLLLTKGLNAYELALENAKDTGSTEILNEIFSIKIQTGGLKGNILKQVNSELKETQELRAYLRDLPIC